MSPKKKWVVSIIQNKEEKEWLIWLWLKPFEVYKQWFHFMISKWILIVDIWSIFPKVLIRYNYRLLIIFLHYHMNFTYWKIFLWLFIMSNIKKLWMITRSIFKIYLSGMLILTKYEIWSMIVGSFYRCRFAVNKPFVNLVCKLVMDNAQQYWE